MVYLCILIKAMFFIYKHAFFNVSYFIGVHFQAISNSRTA